MSNNSINYQKRPSAAPSYEPCDFVYKLLRNSAGSGEIATTAQEFKYAAGDTSTEGGNAVLYWARMVVQVVDAGVDVGDFGGISGGLLNGCLLKIHDADDSILLDCMDGETIKINGDWAHLAAIDVKAETSTGVALDQFTVRWTVEKNGAAMALTQGQHISFTTQDDLSSLSHMHILVHGLEYQIP